MVSGRLQINGARAILHDPQTDWRLEYVADEYFDSAGQNDRVMAMPFNRAFTYRQSQLSQSKPRKTLVLTLPINYSSGDPKHLHDSLHVRGPCEETGFGQELLKF